MIAWLAPIGGLAALAALPVVVHLLSRRIRSERPFPAIALLARAVGGRARVGPLRERLALVARILALIALLLAAAAPVLRGSAAAAGAPVAIVVDASASMHQRGGGSSAWTRAVGAASRLADEVSPRPVLLLVAGSPVRRSASAPDADRGALRALLGEAQPGWGNGSLDSAIAMAVEALHGGGDLYAITDGSRTALAGIDPAALPAGIAWHHVAVAGGEDNLAVRAIAVEPGTAIAGRPLHLRAEIANHGRSAATATVRLTIAGTATTHVVTLPAGGSASAEREVTPEQAGALEIEAALVTGDGDALPEDDRRWGVVPVETAQPVRIYSDADPLDATGVARPLVSACTAAGLAAVVRPGAALRELSATDGRAIVVTVGLARADGGDGLLDHLRHGGVWLHVIASDADAKIGAAGIEPPARPGAVVEPRQGLRLGLTHLDHPLCAGLQGREPLLGRLEAWRYRPAPPLSGSTSLLAWGDGSVALALRPVGPGWWVQLNASPADADGNLAALELLPLIIAHVGEVGGPRRLADAAVACGTVVAASSANAPDGAVVRIDDGAARIDAPGRWLIDGQPRAAAIPATESDLRQAPVEKNGHGEAARQDLAAALAAANDRPLWAWCLLAAAVLANAELLLAGGLPTRASAGRRAP